MVETTRDVHNTRDWCGRLEYHSLMLYFKRHTHSHQNTPLCFSQVCQVKLCTLVLSCPNLNCHLTVTNVHRPSINSLLCVEVEMVGSPETCIIQGTILVAWNIIIECPILIYIFIHSIMLQSRDIVYMIIIKCSQKLNCSEKRLRKHSDKCSWWSYIQYSHGNSHFT